MPKGSHTAAGPALGYLFQFQFALAEILPYALKAEDGAVSVEVVDDVAFHDLEGNPKHAFQVNHSINNTQDLLDTSEKVWKTLAIWTEEWKKLDVDERRSMTLVTTRTVRDGTGLAALAEGSRDVDHALQMLIAVAEDPAGAKGTQNHRATFMTLMPDQQRELLDHVVVADAQTGALGMREKVEQLLRATHELKYVPAMADQLEGWWWRRIVQALSDKQPISAEEARTRIDDARRSLSDQALPILELADFDAPDLPELDPESARFVACLQAIAASDHRLGQAIDDYRRAFAHRSRWGRRSLVLPGELERYEKRLLRQWGISSDQMLRKIENDATAAAKQAAGHDLWDRMESSISEPLRPQVIDGFIQSGSLHMLADDGQLSWHPDEVSNLLALLQPGRSAA
jgi:hypothetical protein